MIKKLVIVFITLFAMQIFAQSGTASPYSFYGIGDLKFKGTVENRSMGGLSIYMDSIHMNLSNPAGYTGNNLEMYNNESRPVKFAVAGSYSSLNLKTQNTTDKASSSAFDYLALSVPVGKFGFGFGLMPFTTVGYKLQSTNDTGGLENRFSGEGGLNKVFFGFGYQINKELSIGVDAHYNFGNIQNKAIQFLYDVDNIMLPYQTRESNRSDLSGFNFNLGVSYITKVTGKLELVSAATFTPKSNLKSVNDRSISTITISSSSGRELVVNTVDVDLQALSLSETDLIMPSKFSLGTGIGQPRKWFAGVEYTLQKTSNFSNPFNSSGAENYEDSNTFSLGGFYIPEYNAFNGYLKRVVYRAGLRFQNTGLYFEEAGVNAFSEPINEFGMSFGLGLPIGNGISNANLGFEIGKRGTTNNNLIQENFINFQLSLSLNDRWFIKRKYD